MSSVTHLMSLFASSRSRLPRTYSAPREPPLKLSARHIRQTTVQLQSIARRHGTGGMERHVGFIDSLACTCRSNDQLEVDHTQPLPVVMSHARNISDTSSTCPRGQTVGFPGQSLSARRGGARQPPSCTDKRRGQDATSLSPLHLTPACSLTSSTLLVHLIVFSRAPTAVEHVPAERGALVCVPPHSSSVTLLHRPLRDHELVCSCVPTARLVRVVTLSPPRLRLRGRLSGRLLVGLVVLIHARPPRLR
ncbi:hypothetical protein L226DRAFT_375657 [Lentinus tigrinus ALCF2SS1-7]|uniref:uncharacterized protein n=1 Tax=Lentinus tigrinus ALCF2SS1-7 TaxID=1328758 RepID=UPI001165CAAB|nr:hypothetical protein L226DRAFT_375657 [Lentinus tigrinus ALCF2SS1-7]